MATRHGFSAPDNPRFNGDGHGPIERPVDRPDAAVVRIIGEDLEGGVDPSPPRRHRLGPGLISPRSAALVIGAAAPELNPVDTTAQSAPQPRQQIQTPGQ